MERLHVQRLALGRDPAVFAVAAQCPIDVLGDRGRSLGVGVGVAPADLPGQIPLPPRVPAHVVLHREVRGVEHRVGQLMARRQGRPAQRTGRPGRPRAARGRPSRSGRRQRRLGPGDDARRWQVARARPRDARRLGPRKHPAGAVCRGHRGRPAPSGCDRPVRPTDHRRAQPDPGRSSRAPPGHLADERSEGLAEDSGPAGPSLRSTKFVGDDELAAVAAGRVRLAAGGPPSTRLRSPPPVRACARSRKP